MNRRNILLVFLTFFAISSFGQNQKVPNIAADVWNSPQLNNKITPQGNSYEEKLFKIALSNNRPQKQFYTLYNYDNKTLDIDKLRSYCAKYNYHYLKDYKTKHIKKFGAGVETVSEFYFMPDAVFIFYVFERIDRVGISSTSLIQKGSLFFYLPNDNKFVTLENALWSGTVVNGKINGAGSGILKKDRNTYYYFNGKFKNGIPQGNVTYRIVNTGINNWWRTTQEAKNDRQTGGSDPYNVEIGDFSEGMASLRVPGDNKYGLVASQNDALYIALNPTYKSFISGFRNGQATVVRTSNKGDEEILIDKKGNYIDLTAKQKKSNQLMAEEKRKKEIADRQAQIERERQAKEDAKRRIEKFRNARPGDRVYYSQDWVSSELFGWIEHRITMRVIGYVEKNVDNGERLQIRVVSVKSSRDDYYKTPDYNGDELYEGKVTWIYPLNDNKWQIE